VGATNLNKLRRDTEKTNACLPDLNLSSAGNEQRHRSGDRHPEGALDEAAGIHRRVDLIGGNLNRGFEIRLEKRAGDTPGGAAGIGKSLLFRAIAGLWRLGSGRVVLPSTHG